MNVVKMQGRDSIGHMIGDAGHAVVEITGYVGDFLMDRGEVLHLSDLRALSKAELGILIAGKYISLRAGPPPV